MVASSGSVSPQDGLCSIASALVAVRSTSPVATGLSILSGLISILTTVSALKGRNMWSKSKPRDLEEGNRAHDQDHNVASNRSSTSPQRSGARLSRRKIFSTREWSHSRESTSITRTHSNERLPLEEMPADSNARTSSTTLQSIAEEDTPVQDLPPSQSSNHATTSTQAGANLRRTSSCVPHESYPTLLELMTFARSHYDIRPYECRTCKRRFTKKHVRRGHDSEKDCKVVPTRF